MNNLDLDSPKRKPLTLFEDAMLFFVMIFVAGLLVYLFLPRVEHMHVDDQGMVTRQWTYGTVDTLQPDKPVAMDEASK